MAVELFEANWSELVCQSQGLVSALLLNAHSKQCWVVLTQIWVKYGQKQMLG